MLNSPAHAKIFLNTFLFELLVLKMVHTSELLFCLPVQCPVFLEIGNTLEHSLVNSLPICQWFNRTHLKWKLDRIVISNELLSPEQIVCNYLSALDDGSIATMDLDFKTTKNVTVLPAARCHQLLSKYFFKDSNDLSFAIYGVFLNVLASQLLCLSNSSFFKPDQLKAMGADVTTIRKLVLQSLIECSIGIFPLN